VTTILSLPSLHRCCSGTSHPSEPWSPLSPWLLEKRGAIWKRSMERARAGNEQIGKGVRISQRNLVKSKIWRGLPVGWMASFLPRWPYERTTFHPTLLTAPPGCLLPCCCHSHCSPSSSLQHARRTAGDRDSFSSQRTSQISHFHSRSLLLQFLLCLPLHLSRERVRNDCQQTGCREGKED
jgi:hypothetical protein